MQGTTKTKRLQLFYVKIFLPMKDNTSPGNPIAKNGLLCVHTVRVLIKYALQHCSTIWKKNNEALIIQIPHDGISLSTLIGFVQINSFWLPAE